jgi:hypothetical protein
MRDDALDRAPAERTVERDPVRSMSPPGLEAVS